MITHTLLSPLKLLSNACHELAYVLDVQSESTIKLAISYTKTERYNNKIEKELEFSIFEVLGGLDYVTMFVKLKHVFITRYKKPQQDGNIDSYDYSIRCLFVDTSGWIRELSILVYFFKDEDSDHLVIVTNGYLKGTWTMPNKVIKLTMRIRDYNKEDGRVSDIIDSDVQKEFLQSFERAFDGCLGF